MDPTHERNITLASLRDAAAPLAGTIKAALVPAEGISFGFALRGARDSNGIATVNVGLPDGPAGNMPSGAFGTAEPVVTVILTVMKFDPAIRSAAILRYSERALRVLRDDLFLDCTVVDAATQQPGINTMDWGIASCCRDGVPGLIWKKGGRDEDSRLILSGEIPADVSSNIIICSNRL